MPQRMVFPLFRQPHRLTPGGMGSNGGDQVCKMVLPMFPQTHFRQQLAENQQYVKNTVMPGRHRWLPTGIMTAMRFDRQFPIPQPTMMGANVTNSS